jgi:predicted phage terminase large subunit-like protein
VEQYQSSIDLTAFKKKMWRGYVHTNYQALIDRTLEQVALYIRSGGADGLSRVMIFLPPRKGKTATVSRHFPAWVIGKMPNTRLIMTSYGASLAGRNSRFVRNLIKSDRFQQLFPEVRLAQDTQSTFEWDIANFDGGMIAAGVGGGITGHGANLIIIDDPIKSRAEAESAVYRQNIKDWYNDDLSTRLEEPGGAIVIIQTRWHQDDLSGWLLDSHNDNWHVLSLPEIAEKDDPLGRNPGEVLWPERYSIDWVLGRQESLGEYSFASLYQQRPIPAGGGLFDALQIKIINESEAPKCIQVVRFYDLAVTVKKTSDYTVGFKLGVTADEQFVIQHVWRVRKEAPDVQEGIVQNAAVDGQNVAIRLEAENAGISQLGYLLRDSRLRGHQIDAKPPIGDKYTRAGPAASRVNNGRVLMVRGTWNQAVLDEFAVFPNGKHDDIVDGFSGAYEMLTTHKPQSWHTTKATGLYKRR